MRYCLLIVKKFLIFKCSYLKTNVSSKYNLNSKYFDFVNHMFLTCRDVWDVWLKAKTTKDCQVSIEDLIPGSR